MTRTRVPNSRLRALIDETEWTQDGLARLVNAVGAEIGLRLRYDRTSVAHWLAGSRPTERVVPLVCEALSRRTRRTITPDQAGFSLRAPSLPSSRTGRLDELLRGLTATVPYRPRDAWPSAPAAFGSSLRAEAGHGEPDAVAFFTHTLVIQGGGFARETLRVYLTEVMCRRLRESRGAARSRARAEASQLTLLLGRMYADDAQHGAAQRCYLLAWELAASAGCREPAVIAVRTLSTQAYTLGHVRVADGAARAAARTAESAPPAVRGFAQAQLAVTAASRGDRTEAMRALSLAEAAVGTRTGPGCPAFDSYGRGDFEYQRAETLLALGDTREATRALESALAARAADDRRGTAMTRVRLATVLLAQGRMEEAHRHERVVSREVQGVNSLALTRQSDSLRHALGRLTDGRRAAAPGHRSATGRPAEDGR